MTTANNAPTQPDAQHPLAPMPQLLVIEPWPDPVVETDPRAHRTASSETLLWWTPVLGPTATLMAHRFATVLARQPQVRITTEDLARTFGLGTSSGRAQATIARLERFGVVTTHGPAVYLRTALPPLSSRQLDHLPGYLRELYELRHP